MEEGGFIYDSGVFNDDLPYYTEVHGQPWPVLPYSFETNDARFWRGGLNSVGDFYEYLKDTFDVLYEEGRTHPKMMSVGLHCRIAGRPARSRALDRFLRYARSHPGVWFARRRRDRALVAGKLPAGYVVGANSHSPLRRVYCHSFNRITLRHRRPRHRGGRRSGQSRRCRAVPPPRRRQVPGLLPPWHPRR